MSARRCTVAVAALAGLFVLSGCPDYGRPDDNLYVHNATDRTIKVTFSADEFLKPDDDMMTLTPGRTKIIAPDTKDGCTVEPLVAFQGGVEIERVDPPICYQDGGLTIAIDGRPGQARFGD